MISLGAFARPMPMRCRSASGSRPPTGSACWATRCTRTRKGTTCWRESWRRSSSGAASSRRMRGDVAPLARTMSRVQWVRIVLATGLLALTTVAITWPLFRHPASPVLDTESVYGPPSLLLQRDINLNIWTLAWDSHALVTDPLHLFHANAFYPARHTLALFDHLLGIVPLFAPLYWP